MHKVCRPWPQCIGQACLTEVVDGPSSVKRKEALARGCSCARAPLSPPPLLWLSDLNGYIFKGYTKHRASSTSSRSSSYVYLSLPTWVFLGSPREPSPTPQRSSLPTGVFIHLSDQLSELRPKVRGAERRPEGFSRAPPSWRGQRTLASPARQARPWLIQRLSRLSAVGSWKQTLKGRVGNRSLEVVDKLVKKVSAVKILESWSTR